MDAKMVAYFVNTIFRVFTVYVHYGSIVGKTSDEGVFVHNVKDGTSLLESDFNHNFDKILQKAPKI